MGVGILGKSILLKCLKEGVITASSVVSDPTYSTREATSLADGVKDLIRKGYLERTDLNGKGGYTLTEKGTKRAKLILVACGFNK